MYCPGLSGEGRGSIGLGRRGSGRLERSNGGPVGPVCFSVFRIFIQQDYTFQSMNGRRELLQKLLFRGGNSSIVQSEKKSLRTSPDRQFGRGSDMMPSSRLHDPATVHIENG